MDRYIRQTILPEIGAIGQEKLAHARIAVIGAGGLGCPALLYLTAAGIGQMSIYDPDEVDLSNLQRQILFTPADIGQNKAQTARTRLLELNSDVRIDAYDQSVDPQLCEKIFSNHDLVIDGTDNFAAKFLLSDAAAKYQKPLISAAIDSFHGQVSIFAPPAGPCLRCLYPTPPVQAIRNCAQAGVIGAVAGMMGSIQALQAIALIIGSDEFLPLIGRIWMIDMKTMIPKILTLHKDPACPSCGENPTMTDTHTPDLKQINWSELSSLDNPYILDVREIDEWNAGHISGAVNHPLSLILAGDYPSLPPHRPIVLHCLKGKRSQQAGEILLQATKTPHADLYNAIGGYEAWLKHSSNT